MILSQKSNKKNTNWIYLHWLWWYFSLSIKDFNIKTIKKFVEIIKAYSLSKCACVKAYITQDYVVKTTSLLELSIIYA